jgi:hypothetical protein
MAGFRVKLTGEYLNSEFALREYRKGKGGVPADITDDWLSSVDIDRVSEGTQATVTDQYGFSYFAGLEQVDGVWKTKYALGPVFQDDEEGTAAEKLAAYKAAKDAEQAKVVRADRSKRLAESDWTQVPDSTADQAAWATYRQALRDVPAQQSFPWTVQWPAKPE